MFDHIWIQFEDGATYGWWDNIVDAFQINTGEYDATDPVLEHFWIVFYNDIIELLGNKHGAPQKVRIHTLFKD